MHQAVSDEEMLQEQRWPRLPRGAYRHNRGGVRSATDHGHPCEVRSRSPPGEETAFEGTLPLLDWFWPSACPRGPDAWSRQSRWRRPAGERLVYNWKF